MTTCDHSNAEYDVRPNENNVEMGVIECECGYAHSAPVFYMPKEPLNISDIDILNMILNRPFETMTVGPNDVITIPVYKILQAMNYSCAQKVYNIADKLSCK